jgi:hypothetical protein
MVTVHREGSFRFVIYTDDHEPAHVHVIVGGEMKVTIRGASGLPEVTSVVGIKTRDRRRVMDIIRNRQDELLAAWREIHGERE